MHLLREVFEEVLRALGCKVAREHLHLILLQMNEMPCVVLHAFLKSPNACPTRQCVSSAYFQCLCECCRVQDRGAFGWLAYRGRGETGLCSKGNHWGGGFLRSRSLGGVQCCNPEVTALFSKRALQASSCRDALWHLMFGLCAVAAGEEVFRVTLGWIGQQVEALRNPQ